MRQICIVYCELYLKQPEFTYGVCGPFAKHCERIQKFREAGTLIYLFKNILDKACFTHDAAHSHNKDLAKRAISHKILKYRTNGIARNCRYDKYQRALASMVYKFFDEKAGLGVSVNEKTSSKIT